MPAALLGACTTPRPAPAPPAHPQRIVSLSPCVDAILTQLVSPTRIAAISSYSQDPRATSMDLALAHRLPAIAGTAEEVLVARPDLVLAGAHVAPATRAALSQAGVPVVTSGVPDSIAAARAEVRAVAAAVGERTHGEALLARIDAALAESAAPPTVPALVWLGDGLVPGRGTLVADMLRHSGFIDAADRYGLKSWDLLPTEAMLARPPRVVFTDPGSAIAPGGSRVEASRSLRTRLLARAPGVTLVAFPQQLVYCGGPTLIRMAAVLHRARAALDASR